MSTFTLHWIFLRCEHITNLLRIVGWPPSLRVKRATETVYSALLDSGGIRGSVREWVMKVVIALARRRRWGHRILAFRTAVSPLILLAFQCSLNLHCFVVFARFHFSSKCTCVQSVLPGIVCLFYLYHLIGNIIDKLIDGALWFHLCVDFLFMLGILLFKRFILKCSIGRFLCETKHTIARRKLHFVLLDRFSYATYLLINIVFLGKRPIVSANNFVYVAGLKFARMRLLPRGSIPDRFHFFT